jgi:hypothetical protein
MVRCIVSRELTVNNKNAAEVIDLMAKGWSVRFLPATNGEKVERIRRKRRRAPNVTTEQLKEMIGLREKGLTYRIIARRYRMSIAGTAHAIRRGTKKKGA